MRDRENGQRSAGARVTDLVSLCDDQTLISVAQRSASFFVLQHFIQNLPFGSVRRYGAALTSDDCALAAKIFASNIIKRHGKATKTEYDLW